MSTISADNIQPSAGGTARNAVRGIAAAWANLNGTGTIALRDSQNVSSVVDIGVGDYQFNYSNAMLNINYSNIGASGQTGITHGITLTQSALVGSTSYITTSSTFVNTDSSRFVVNVNGDLA